MGDLVIRLYRLDGHGLVDDETDFSLSDFGGNLPIVGDQILYPLVEQGLSRAELENREILTVARRVFNPRDLKDYVALVCTTQMATEADREFIPPH